LVSLLVKLPVPAPSFVCARSVVGSGTVSQQIPAATSALLPSEVTMPPQDAVDSVAAFTAEVLTTGSGEFNGVVTGVGVLVVFFLQLLIVTNTNESTAIISLGNFMRDLFYVRARMYIIIYSPSNLL
jgi:hypothetical protein